MKIKNILFTAALLGYLGWAVPAGMAKFKSASESYQRIVYQGAIPSDSGTSIYQQTR